MLFLLINLLGIRHQLMQGLLASAIAFGFFLSCRLSGPLTLLLGTLIPMGSGQYVNDLLCCCINTPGKKQFNTGRVYLVLGSRPCI